MTATMALSLAILSRQIHLRSVAAFTPQIRSFTATTNKSPTKSTSSPLRRTRRFRPKQSSDSLSALLEEMERKGIPLHLSAVETVNGVANETDGSDDDMSALFPQKGKNIEDCAPRMRFAPSPTGR